MLELAQFYAQWSKDPRTKVGAVIVRADNTIASYGYNGFPRGVADFPERYMSHDQKYEMVVHAEANAILHAVEPLHSMTIYLTLPPCSSCAGLIIQAGICKVVHLAPSDDRRARWAQSFAAADLMFNEAGVVRKEVVL